MARVATIAGGLLLAVAAAAPAVAQEDQGIEFSVFLSGNKPMQDLNTQPAASFKSGFGGGAGASLVLDRNLGIRFDASFAKSDITATNLGPAALVSTSWSRIMVGGDLVLRFPMDNGIMPYLTTGGGAIMFNESGGRSPTRAAGRFGAGLKFPVGDKLGLFGQANAAPGRRTGFSACPETPGCRGRRLYAAPAFVFAPCGLAFRGAK